MIPISYSIHQRPVRVKVTSLTWACYSQPSPPFLQFVISHQGIDGCWRSPTLVCVSCTLSSPIHAMFCTPAKSTASFHFTCGLKRALFSSVCKHCIVTLCKHCGGPTGSTGKMGDSCYWIWICILLPSLSQNITFHGTVKVRERKRVGCLSR